MSSNRFNKGEIDHLWTEITQKGKFSSVDKYLFRLNFEGLKFSGFSSVREVRSAAPGTRTTIVSLNSSNYKWEADIMEKLR